MYNVNFEFDDKGRVISYTDPFGNTCHMTYFYNGELASFANDNVQITNNFVAKTSAVLDLHSGRESFYNARVRQYK